VDQSIVGRERLGGRIVMQCGKSEYQKNMFHGRIWHEGRRTNIPYAKMQAMDADEDERPADTGV
jgi:hypothetical protein